MKIPFLKAMHRGQRGGLLITSALLIFVFVSLCFPPLFSYLNTGLMTTKNTGAHTQEIYAAEAGVYDSIWKVIMLAPGVPFGTWDPPLQYTVPGGVNGKQVSVTVSVLNSFNYHVNAAATDPQTNHRSTVDADFKVLGVQGLDLNEFTKYAVTSNGTISSQYNNVKINGNVWIPDASDYQANPPNGNIVVAPITGWPTPAQLETYYSYLVDTSHPYTGATINLADPAVRGPLYASGAGNYVLTGTGNLTGDLYINGNLFLDQYANVHLNGNTIFVTGSVSTQPQSYLAGPGALIAIGDIGFSPKVAPAYLLVMSISGSVNFQPNGAFVGAVGGNVNITMKPNCSITWTNPGLGNLDLPGVYNHVTAMQAWNIH